jgi:hypothetical protein
MSAGLPVVAAILVIPALGAAVLALVQDDRKGAWLNAFFSFLTFVCALALLLVERPEPGPS